MNVIDLIFSSHTCSAERISMYFIRLRVCWKSTMPSPHHTTIYLTLENNIRVQLNVLISVSDFSIYFDIALLPPDGLKIQLYKFLFFMYWGCFFSSKVLAVVMGNVNTFFIFYLQMKIRTH